MSEENKQYFVIMDFLFQKYEVEYETNMSPQRVIEKVQGFLLPNERDVNMISTKNEEKHDKLQLYKSDFPNYYGLVPVTENIKEEDIDYSKYQFYLFRPMINVYLTLYVVEEGNIGNDSNILKLDLIFPVKKTFSHLKEYLRETLQLYARKTNNNFLMTSLNKRLKFQLKSNMKVSNDNEFIEQWMNDTELYLVVNNESDHRLCSIGRIYYFLGNDLNNIYRNEIESLDYDMDGLTISYAKKKLIEKHQCDFNIPEDKIIITFNGIVQTEKFDRLDDLFSDNRFYYFTVFFEPPDMKLNLPGLQPIQNGKRSYSIPIPKYGRPLIAKIE